MYIGSSINLAVRLINHLGYGNTNQNLQNAIAKYGLENFEFCVLEFCDRLPPPLGSSIYAPPPNPLGVRQLSLKEGWTEGERRHGTWVKCVHLRWTHYY